jgi:hypothetical protein
MDWIQSEDEANCPEIAKGYDIGRNSSLERVKRKKSAWVRFSQAETD